MVERDSLDVLRGCVLTDAMTALVRMLAGAGWLRTHPRTWVTAPKYDCSIEYIKNRRNRVAHDN